MWAAGASGGRGAGLERQLLCLGNTSLGYGMSELLLPCSPPGAAEGGATEGWIALQTRAVAEIAMDVRAVAPLLEHPLRVLDGAVSGALLGSALHSQFASGRVPALAAAVPECAAVTATVDEERPRPKKRVSPDAPTEDLSARGRSRLKLRKAPRAAVEEYDDEGSGGDEEFCDGRGEEEAEAEAEEEAKAEVEAEEGGSADDGDGEASDGAAGCAASMPSPEPMAVDTAEGTALAAGGEAAMALAAESEADAAPTRPASAGDSAVEAAAGAPDAPPPLELHERAPPATVPPRHPWSLDLVEGAQAEMEVGAEAGAQMEAEAGPGAEMAAVDAMASLHDDLLCCRTQLDPPTVRLGPPGSRHTWLEMSHAEACFKASAAATLQVLALRAAHARVARHASALAEPTRCCAEGHPLICSPLADDGDTLYCDGCQGALGPAAARWSCRACDYDVCAACLPRCAVAPAPAAAEAGSVEGEGGGHGGAKRRAHSLLLLPADASSVPEREEACSRGLSPLVERSVGLAHLVSSGAAGARAAHVESFGAMRSMCRCEQEKLAGLLGSGRQARRPVHALARSATLEAAEIALLEPLQRAWPRP